MRIRHELHLDLSDCELESRSLMALGPGLYPSPFMPIGSSSNQLIVTGTSSGGSGPSGGTSYPGPSWYYLRLGVNLNANGSGVAGSTIGGTVSIYGQRLAAPASGGGGGGASSDSSGGGGNGAGASSGGLANVGGYGASFSSGYGFSLSSGNNYGMFSSTGATVSLGSVPVHTYSGGGDAMEEPVNPNQAGIADGSNSNSGALTPANFGLGLFPQGPSLGNRLLGKSPLGPGSQLIKPPQTNP